MYKLSWSIFLLGGTQRKHLRDPSPGYLLRRCYVLPGTRFRHPVNGFWAGGLCLTVKSPSHVGSEATHTVDSSGVNGLKGDFGSSGKLGKAVPDRILGSVSPGREVGTIRVISTCLHCPHGYREHTRETQTCAYHLNLKCALATAWLTAYWSEQA